jgi:ubiquinone/menaquinone biosynthesis C-methylase UbiE
MADVMFAEPRLADIYDAVEFDRSDLDAYVALVEEFNARSLLDLGCGTGTFACLLARRAKSVIGVDPAAASIAGLDLYSADGAIRTATRRPLDL